jgi:OmcA/MtrC family decaheme c-type cytochrome
MKFRVQTPRIFFFAVLFLIGSALAIAAIVEDSSQIYSALQKAFYLSEDDAVWIRPGLNIQILDAKIPSDRKAVVTLKMTDDKNQPLDRSGNLTPGAVNASFILAYIPQNASQYVAYTVRTQTSPITGVTALQASTDTNGKWAELGDGMYTYTFNTAVPITYDSSATHTVGIYATRNLREFGLSLYMENAVKNFVPDGRQVTKIREVAVTASCNQCHDPLTAHGETGRKDMEICILCHTPQTPDPDTGNTTDMKVMTHKIHMGEALPSVQAGTPYVIVGRGGPTDFSKVVFPMEIRNCAACHKDSAQVNAWMLNPTADTCGSCHDTINFKTGQGHAGGPQPDDRDCYRCHWPEGTYEYDASVAGAHTVPDKSTQLRKPKVEILSITNTAPGQKPVVKFKITDKNGAAIAPSSMSRFTLRLAGPTTDYKWYNSETATAATYADGVATYTFTTVAIPADATGTYALEAEGRMDAVLNPGTTKQFTYRDAPDNVVKYFAVTGSVVFPRRTVVDIAKCNKCHDRLQLHGNNRNQVEACILCHNPAGVYPATGATSQSIDMRIMIHKIHTGEELEGEYTIANANFNEILYPGDRRNCLACHVGTSYTLPLPATNAAVMTPQDLWNPTLPASASCLSCHDSVESAVHAYTNTATFGEACSVCHKETAEFAVTKIHAR